MFSAGTLAHRVSAPSAAHAARRAPSSLHAQQGTGAWDTSRYWLSTSLGTPWRSKHTYAGATNAVTGIGVSRACVRVCTRVLDEGEVK